MSDQAAAGWSVFAQQLACVSQTTTGADGSALVAAPAPLAITARSVNEPLRLRTRYDVAPGADVCFACQPVGQPEPGYPTGTTTAIVAELSSDFTQLAWDSAGDPSCFVAITLSWGPNEYLSEWQLLAPDTGNGRWMPVLDASPFLADLTAIDLQASRICP